MSDVSRGSTLKVEVREFFDLDRSSPSADRRAERHSDQRIPMTLSELSTFVKALTQVVEGSDRGNEQPASGKRSLAQALVRRATRKRS